MIAATTATSKLAAVKISSTAQVNPLPPSCTRSLKLSHQKVGVKEENYEARLDCGTQHFFHACNLSWLQRRYKRVKHRPSPREVGWGFCLTVVLCRMWSIQDCDYNRTMSNQLLSALQTEIRKHNFDCFVDEPPSIVQGGKGVVVPGCPTCKKKFYTMAQFIEHIAEDVLPGIVQG